MNSDVESMLHDLVLNIRAAQDDVDPVRRIRLNTRALAAAQTLVELLSELRITDLRRIHNSGCSYRAMAPEVGLSVGRISQLLNPKEPR